MLFAYQLRRLDIRVVKLDTILGAFIAIQMLFLHVIAVCSYNLPPQPKADGNNNRIFMNL